MSKDFDASQSSKGVPRDYKTATPYSSRPSQGITPELLSLVKRTALHLKGRLPKSVEVDDLMQSGLEGLIQAMDSFDESRNITLEPVSYTHLTLPTNREV